MHGGAAVGENHSILDMWCVVRFARHGKTFLTGAWVRLIMFKMFAVRKRAILNACMRRANAPWRMYVREAHERTLITSQTSKFAIHQSLTLNYFSRKLQISLTTASGMMHNGSECTNNCRHFVLPPVIWGRWLFLFANILIISALIDLIWRRANAPFLL